MVSGAESFFCGTRRSDGLTGNVCSVLTRNGSTPERFRALRITSLVLGSVAVLAMVVVGCTNLTEGSVTANSEEAPAFRKSMSSSVSASKATSISEESERQASSTAAAISNACQTLSVGHDETIRTVNEYVAALNDVASTADDDARAGPAVEALNREADNVSGSVSPALSQELQDSLIAWADAARAVANVIIPKANTDAFNAAIDGFNVADDAALELCLAVP